MPIKSMILDHCWVCNTKFAPKGPAHEERHHIVPRAYGGEDGPMVSLCDTCHTRLHKTAVALSSNKPTYLLLQGLNPEAQKRIYYLASCVVNAKAATENDPNKKTMVTLQLSGQETQKLDQLKRALNVPSRSAVILAAVESLYKRTFSVL